MPSAPKSLAVFVSKGVSEFVLILSFLNSSAQPNTLEKSTDISGLTVGISPKIIFPLEPSIVIISPSFTICSEVLNNLFL